MRYLLNFIVGQQSDFVRGLLLITGRTTTACIPFFLKTRKLGNAFRMMLKLPLTSAFKRYPS